MLVNFIVLVVSVLKKLWFNLNRTNVTTKSHCRFKCTKFVNTYLLWVTLISIFLFLQIHSIFRFSLIIDAVHIPFRSHETHSTKKLSLKMDVINSAKLIGQVVINSIVCVSPRLDDLPIFYPFIRAPDQIIRLHVGTWRPAKMWCFHFTETMYYFRFYTTKNPWQ